MVYSTAWWLRHPHGLVHSTSDHTVFVARTTGTQCQIVLLHNPNTRSDHLRGNFGRASQIRLIWRRTFNIWRLWCQPDNPPILSLAALFPALDLPPPK